MSKVFFGLYTMLKIVYIAGLAYVCSFAFAAIDNEVPRESHSDRYQLHPNCLVHLNKQVNNEMYASMVYMNMGGYFDHNNVARKGFAKFFADQSREEKEHAHKLIDYINRRGGRVDILDVRMPDKNSWLSGKDAFQDALSLEKQVNNDIFFIHEVAEKQCRDPHLMDFMESEFMEEQVGSINQITRIITILREMEGGMGEYLVDRQLLEGKFEESKI